MPPRKLIDDTDRRILDLLTEDARRTISDIAARVNLSPAPVKRRIDRLEREGVISGYTVLVDHDKMGAPLEAYTELRFSGDTATDTIISAASEIEEVQAVFAIAGDPDALVRIRAEDVEHLQRVVNALRRTASVTGTKTLMVLSSWTRSDQPRR